uniref:VWFA domain-containing protein n=1 Tax=Ditylenchus dipsaci TaxID=166011 RepID=A0A915EPD7_9BILA
MDYEVQPRRWSDFSGVLPLSSKSESEAENVPYTPCQKQIVIIYDCSNGISSSEFKKQLDFLSNKLLATNWNHFERLGLGFYGSSTLLNPFKLTNRADQLKKYIQFTSQSRRKASVNTLFGALALDEVYRQNRSLDVSTIVFISNASSKDIAAAQQYASTVNGFGQLTVVTLKPSSLSASAVTLLTSNVIEWDIGQKDEPDNWQQLFQAAYGCGGAITVQDKFVPCPTSKRQIVVAIDASNNLTAAEFQMEKSFLVNQVFSTNNWNHFERLGISAYAKFVSSRSFGILNSSEDMVNTINAITQQRKSPSLSTLLRDLNEKYPNNSTQPNAYIVFTSRAHPADVTQAVNDSLALASRGRLTFVALNGVDVDQLKRLSNNIIAWNMTTTSSPSDWQNAFMQAYNCVI